MKRLSVCLPCLLWLNLACAQTQATPQATPTIPAGARPEVPAMPGNAVTSSAPPTSPTGTGSHESAESTTRTRQIPSELERASQSSKKNEAELAAQAELLKSQTEAIKELARRVSELEQRLNKLSPKGKKP